MSLIYWIAATKRLSQNYLYSQCNFSLINNTHFPKHLISKLINSFRILNDQYQNIYIIYLYLIQNTKRLRLNFNNKYYKITHYIHITSSQNIKLQYLCIVFEMLKGIIQHRWRKWDPGKPRYLQTWNEICTFWFGNAFFLKLFYHWIEDIF